jgi:acyl carrier protein
MDISKKLKEIFMDLFFVEETIIQDGLSQDDVENWDSMQHLNLILAIEEVFTINISPEESNEMLNFGLIVLLIEEKLVDVN